MSVLPGLKHRSGCDTVRVKVVFLLLSEVLCVSTRGPKFCVEENRTSPATPSWRQATSCHRVFSVNFARWRHRARQSRREPVSLAHLSPCHSCHRRSVHRQHDLREGGDLRPRHVRVALRHGGGGAPEGKQHHLWTGLGSVHQVGLSAMCGFSCEDCEAAVWQRAAAYRHTTDEKRNSRWMMVPWRNFIFFNFVYYFFIS